MKLKYRPMALIGFIVLLVFFICIYISTSAAVISIAIGCVLMIASLLIKQLRKSVFTFFISAALILSGTVFMFAPSYNAEKISKYDGKDCVITGSIDDEPNYENSRYYYTLKLRSVDDEKCNFKLRLSTHSKLDAEIFDTVSLRAKAYLLGDYNEDIMLYYRSHGVYLGAYTYNSGDIIVEKCEKPPLKYHFLKLRMQIENRIIEKLPNEYGGIVIGMLTGNKAFISDNVNEHIKNAGIAPLFAVSGLHFSIWVMSLYSLLDVLKVNKRLNSIINIAFSLFFIALTGFSMSVCRAGLMLILLLVGNLFFRKSDSLNSLGFAVLILCLVNPMSAADYGFLLSVSATLGIIIIYPILNRHILENLKNNIFEKILKAVLSVVFVSLCAIIGTFPITVLFVKKISLFTIFSNLFVTYPATICILFGGLSVIFHPISFISDAMIFVSGLMSKYILYVVETVNFFDVKLISTADIFWQAGTVFSFVLICVLYGFFKGKQYIKAVCVSLSAVIIFCSTFSYLHYENLTEINVLNVGNSLGIVISDGKNKYVICGAADYDFYSQTVSDKLDEINFNENKLALILSDGTAYAYHMNDLIKNQKFEKIVLPSSNSTINQFADEDNLMVKRSAEFELFNNAEAKYICTENYSAVRCKIGDFIFAIIFNSDGITQIQEEFLKADILVCGNKLPQMLNTMNYNEIIISSDEKSGKKLFDSLISSEIPVLTTYKNRNIKIEVKNDDYKIKAEVI